MSRKLMGAWEECQFYFDPGHWCDAKYLITRILAFRDREFSKNKNINDFMAVIFRCDYTLILLFPYVAIDNWALHLNPVNSANY